MNPDEITIHIFEDSAGDYQYSIFFNKSPEDVAAHDCAPEGDDGGACTTSLVEAVRMACDQAGYDADAIPEKAHDPHDELGQHDEDTEGQIDEMRLNA